MRSQSTRCCPACGRTFEADRWRVEHLNRRYCSIACANRDRRAPAVERFWSNVLCDVRTRCWIWTGATVGGYGRFRGGPGGAKVMAHRFAWEMLVGPCPDGMDLCHDCPAGDDPRCVAPEHHYWAPHRTNMRDASVKGQMARGERSGRARLTTAQVDEMRRAYTGQYGQVRALARQFGVHENSVRQILKGRQWRASASQANTPVETEG